ncbi:MAG: methyltransferase domain-containing protein [Chloroflexi bacterium]|nr:methyltransferase domain-containing protein [Chloroflexota bacterium]
MTLEDAQRWNERYLGDQSPSPSGPRDFLVEHAGLLPASGLALDLAMGLGYNAGFLIDNGLQVIGVDISSIAVQRARKRFPEIQAVVADCNHLIFPRGQFDVILNFYYLERELWPGFRRILKPGGILLVETLTQGMLRDRPDIAPEYLLDEGELLTSFWDWDILAYREGWFTNDRGNEKAIASLAARRPF